MPQDEPYAAAPEGDTAPLAAAADETTEPKRLRDFGIAAALLGQKGLVGAVRLLLPLIEEFARSGELHERATRQISLSKSEREVLKVAAAKFAYELIEYASQKHPVEGVDGYVASVGENREYPEPKTAHLLSLATLIKELVSPLLSCPPPPQTGGGTASPGEVPVEPIVLMSVGADEYRLITRPLTPLEIRQAAGRQRELNLRTRG